MSSELSDFFKLLAEDKKKKKEEFDSVVGDLGLDSLFEEFATLKKKEKEKKVEEKKKEESLIGDITLDSVFEEVVNLKKETKKKKVQEEKTVKAFEKWLYSETAKEQEQIIDDVIENSLDEVLEVLEDHKEELEDLNEPKEDLIEKSLGLLSEPSNVKMQNDPLTPLDQNFATLDDLQKHYKLFLNRIQQQLSTLGGGGETRLEFLDDVDRDSAKTDNYFLQYDEITNKWIGSNDGSTISGIVTYIDAGPNIFVSSHVGIVTITGIGLTIGDAPPVDPIIYPLWWDSTVGKPYLYYPDGDSTQWVEFAPGCGGGEGGGGGGANLPQNLDVTLGYGNTSNLGMSVGVVTAISYYGNGAPLSGIVTYLIAGTGIDISANTGRITINATGIGSTGSFTQLNANWDAVTGVTSILNKPVIPAAQVNSDWNATTGISSILNKPTIVNQIIAGTGITISPTNGIGTVTINATGLGTATRYYGSYYDTISQSCSGIGVSTPMLLRSIANESGFSVANQSRITSTYGGVYNTQFSVQLDKPSGATGHIWIWLRKNGINIPDTTSVVAVQGTNAETVAAWNFIVDMNAGDYVEYMWMVDDTQVQLTRTEPITSISSPGGDIPVNIPGIPSVIVTIQQV
jgi:hypothetical protein